MEDSNSTKISLELKKASEFFGKVKESIEYRETRQIQAFNKVVDNADKEMAELNERKIALRKQLEDKANSIKNLEEELSKLKESSKSQEIMGFKVKVDLAEKENKRLQTLLTAKQEFLEKKRKENQSKSAKTLENKLKYEAELEACLVYLHMAISRDDDDNIKFSFKNVSDAEPEKLFYFIVYLNESVYEVKACQPELDNINVIISQLNKDRDLIAFIKRMRKEFVKVAND